uniref:BZIP domain-containing protein n=1 Tax=Oryza nivara TaxID=4536 RepID=A0A0E0J264_ORYNI
MNSCCVLCVMDLPKFVANLIGFFRRAEGGRRRAQLGAMRRRARLGAECLAVTPCPSTSPSIGWFLMASSSGRGGSIVSAAAGRGGRRQRWLARRLRMRKQRHLDGLTAQVAHLRRDNAHVATVLGLTTQGLLAVDAENAVLRT